MKPYDIRALADRMEQGKKWYEEVKDSVERDCECVDCTYTKMQLNLWVVSILGTYRHDDLLLRSAQVILEEGQKALEHFAEKN